MTTNYGIRQYLRRRQITTLDFPLARWQRGPGGRCLFVDGANVWSYTPYAPTVRLWYAQQIARWWARLTWDCWIVWAAEVALRFAYAARCEAVQAQSKRGKVVQMSLFEERKVA